MHSLLMGEKMVNLEPRRWRGHLAHRAGTPPTLDQLLHTSIADARSLKGSMARIFSRISGGRPLMCNIVEDISID